MGKLRFDNMYETKEMLGKGAFSTVFRCVETVSRKEYAVKVIENNELVLTKRHDRKLEMEAYICRKLDHPHIVKFIKVFKEPSALYFVFELMSGGELFDDLTKRIGDYTEEVTASCMQQILEAVEYMHSVNVVHRDIKPENILLDNAQDKNIKITDFGLAIEVEKDETRRFGSVGSPHYMSPEVIVQMPYGRPVDLWACGVIMYIMLCGRQPFAHKDQRKLFKLITDGDYDLTSGMWEKTTEEAKDLIRKLICVIPTRRLTATQALQHEWFSTVKTCKLCHRQDTLEKLKEFNAIRKFRAAVDTHIIVHRLLLANY